MMLLKLYSFHGKRDAVTAEVDGNDTDTDVLVEVYDAGGVGDIFVGQLADVDESVLVYTDIDEGSEVGDICHNARQFHAFV